MGKTVFELVRDGFGQKYVCTNESGYYIPFPPKVDDGENGSIFINLCDRIITGTTVDVKKNVVNDSGQNSNRIVFFVFDVDGNMISDFDYTLSSENYLCVSPDHILVASIIEKYSGSYDILYITHLKDEVELNLDVYIVPTYYTDNEKNETYVSYDTIMDACCNKLDAYQKHLREEKKKKEVTERIYF